MFHVKHYCELENEREDVQREISRSIIEMGSHDIGEAGGAVREVLSESD